MRSTFRLLLLWLMALALPVQGWAAAAGQHCAAMHERMQVSAGHHHDAAAAEHHHDAGATAAHADADADATAHEATPAALDASGVKCSACAACCAAVGLPARALDLPSPPPAGVQAAAAEPAPVAFLTDGLERPPRTLLA